MGEDLVDHRPLRDERDDPHRPATRRTRERVDLKDLLEQGGPPAGGLGRRESGRGDDGGWPVRRGGRRLVPHAAGAVGIFNHLLASPLLEAEARSVMVRERLPASAVHLGDLQWILPASSLSSEIARVLYAGYVRGADCWQLACALHVADNPSEITFLTLDTQQRKIAKALGFKT